MDSCRGLSFFFSHSSSRRPAFVFLLLSVLGIMFLLQCLLCGIFLNEAIDHPVESRHPQPVMYYCFFLIHEMIGFASVKPQIISLRPELVCWLILTQSPFWAFLTTGLNVNVNTWGAKSVTAYIHPQAQRAAVCHLAPALLFFLLLSKEANLALGSGPFENRPETSPALCSLSSFLLTLLDGSTPLNHDAVKHTTVSFGSHAVFAPVVFVMMSGNLTFEEWAETKTTKLFMLFISQLPLVFLQILKHTRWMYGQKSKWLWSICSYHVHEKEITVKALKPMLQKGKARPKLVRFMG